MNIREKLGLGPKKDNATSTLTDDYVEQAQQQADNDTAAQLGASDDDTTVEAPMTEEEAMRDASERITALSLGEGSWSLIDRAMDSLARNTGTGLEDPDAVARAKQLASLIRAADNNLEIVVRALVGSTPVLDRPGVVYSLLYRVVQQSVFFANLDLRQAEGIDLYSDDALVAEFFARYTNSEYVDEALSRVVHTENGDVSLSPDDQREKQQSDAAFSDMGFEARRDIELRYLFEKYGSDDLGDAVVRSLEDVQLLCDLTAQSFGWPNDRPMPYANVREPNGSYTPITDARTALDAQEIKRKASQQRRREARAEQMSKAQLLAAEIVTASLARPTIHRRK